MKDTEKVLKEELSNHFAGQSQRLTMLAKIVIGMLKLSTISYSKLSLTINPRVKRDSNFKRIQRFVRSYSFCHQCYIQLAWSLFVSPNEWVALSIDRTNWKFGKKNMGVHQCSDKKVKHRNNHYVSFVGLTPLNMFFQSISRSTFLNL